MKGKQMAQAVSNRASNRGYSVALSIDVAMSREVARWKSGMVHGMLQEPLPSVTRAKMQSRFAMVQDSLRSAPQGAIEEAVSTLMTGYPSMRNVREVDAIVMTRKYADDLSDLPLWAINAACNDLAKGAVSDTNPDFPPSSARIHQLADNHIKWAAKEALDLKAVLTAEAEPPENPEMRERIKLGFAKLQGRLHAKIEEEKPKPQEKRPVMTKEQLAQHYAGHGLGYTEKPKSRDVA